MMKAASQVVDESRVLDIKPLRTLFPVFPDSMQSPLLVSSPHSGLYPSGLTSFCPFSITEEAPSSAGGMHKDDRSVGIQDCDRRSKSSRKKARKMSSTMGSGRQSRINYVMNISSNQQDNGDKEVVNHVLMIFDALRRRLSQIDDAEDALSNHSSSVHMKAGNIFLRAGLRTNMIKRIGAVPGIEIGDIFFFRMEMYLVGLHCQPMAGIDYMSDSGNWTQAISIVSAGRYDNDTNDSDALIYSGQGGNFNEKDKQATNQKLERGNLALERSLQRGNEVRVIRGMKDATTTRGKVYVYDGLYTIKKSWIEKAKGGCNMFKYKLVRLPGQPSAFNIWKSVDKWREQPSSIPGLIHSDISSGAESIPISLVNDVDDEREPASFTYCPTLIYSESFSLTQPDGCSCLKACQPGDSSCLCIHKNGGEFPYTANGILVSRKPLLYECGSSCLCFYNCKNRVAQTGLKVHLEVFKTGDRGWGLRSWDPIRAGTFICEFAGEVNQRNDLELNANETDNDEYTFDTSRNYDWFKWNYEPGLLGEESAKNSAEEYKIPYPLTISAKNIGNVARFMNHSCSPNVFWQPVVYEQNNQCFLHVAFFAMRHIPPLVELTYDYGTVCTDRTDDSGALRGGKKCLCRSSACRGYFG